MGAGNVKAIYGLWRHLPDPAFRVLVYMGLVSIDTDSPPAYWGGREALALCMGRPEPHTDADWRAVTRAMRILRDAGAVVAKGHSPLTNARYELQLDLVSVDAGRPANRGRGTSSEQGTLHDHHGGRHTTEQGTPDDRTHDVSRPLKEEQEPQRLNQGLGGSPCAEPSDRENPDPMDEPHGFVDDQTPFHDCGVCSEPARSRKHQVEAVA